MDAWELAPMQISDNKNLKLDNTVGAKKDALKDSKADSSVISEATDSIDNLFGLFEDDGDYSEIVGDLLDDDHLERQNAAIAGENVEQLGEIFDVITLIDDPGMQEFFNQQIIDASSSLNAKQEYLKQGKEEGDSSDAVEASLF